MIRFLNYRIIIDGRGRGDDRLASTIEDEDIEKLQVGQSMDQVRFILGSPMIKDPFRSNRWDYLNLITVGDEKIVEKKLVVIFDDENLLSSWKIVSE